jgi:hypothetical protein
MEIERSPYGGGEMQIKMTWEEFLNIATDAIENSLLREGRICDITFLTAKVGHEPEHEPSEQLGSVLITLQWGKRWDRKLSPEEEGGN